MPQAAAHINVLKAGSHTSFKCSGDLGEHWPATGLHRAALQMSGLY